MKNYNIYHCALIILLFCHFQSLKSQTKHNIQVSNSVFSPSLLTVEEGDTVVWANSAGFHNVNGQSSTYPNNHVSFGNSLGTGWTYSFVFTVPGTYDYRCDAHYGSGMTGKVIVNNTSSVKYNNNEIKSALFYPNPCTELLNIKLSDVDADKVEVYNSIGSLVFSKRIDLNHSVLDLEAIPAGIYIVKFITVNNIIFTRKLIKE